MEVYLAILTILVLVRHALSSCVQTSSLECSCSLSSTDSLPALLSTVGPDTETLIITGTLTHITNCFGLANLARVRSLTLDLGVDVVDELAFSGLPNIQTLVLKDNKVKSIGKLPTTLRSLDLSGNSLTQWPEIESVCLENVNLSRNNILDVRFNDIVGSDCLRSLDLSDNDLKFIKARLPATLVSLNLSRNDISWENSNLTGRDLRELILIDAEYPQEGAISPLSGLSSLEKLDLSHSDLYRLPKSVNVINETLKVLKLSNNPFEEIGAKSFRNTGHLSELFLDSCRIAKISDAPFSELRQLVNLDLSNNYIQAINSTVLNSTVQKLNLQNSRIGYIKPGTMDYLPNLKELNLSHNLLKYIESSVLDNFPNATINLWENPIRCDCYVRDIRDWISKYDVNMTIFCDTPETLDDRPVTSVKDGELDCRPPVFEDCCIRTVNAYEHSNITIHFRTNAKPLAEMSFKVVNGNPLPENKTRFTPTEHTVMIHNVTQDDSGNFSCTASNEFGQTTIFVTVQVFPGGPEQYRIRLAEIIVIILISTIVLFAVVWFCVFICSKNRYFVYEPWVEDDLESSYGSIQIRR